ncbi:hypothetical protein GQ457_01G054420 [Hibiscus cannabinus]
MRCVESVLVLNGIVGDSFESERGLRQGDPLSPYLYLICCKGLSSLLRQASLNNTLIGTKINRYTPSMPHLLFADDYIIFGDATARRVWAIKKVLDEYARCSRQQIKLI